VIVVVAVIVDVGNVEGWLIEERKKTQPTPEGRLWCVEAGRKD